MKKFHEWIKLREAEKPRNWHDFELSRGRLHQRYDGRVGSGMPLSSISDDEGLKKALSQGSSSFRDAISDMKMLHDRILDSHTVTAKDFKMFISTMMDSIPGDEESHEVKTAWGYVISELDF